MSQETDEILRGLPDLCLLIFNNNFIYLLFYLNVHCSVIFSGMDSHTNLINKALYLEE